MAFTRREFIAALGALGLVGCETAQQMAEDITLPRPRLPKFRRTDREFAFAALGNLGIASMRDASVANRAIVDLQGRDDVAFVVALGGLARNGRLTELQLAKQTFERLDTRPYYVVPGAGDLDPANPDRFDDFDRLFERGNWTFRWGAWTFVGFDATGGPDAPNAVREDRLAWLRDRAGEAKGPVALCCHGALSPAAGDARLENAGAVLEAFAGADLRLVLNAEPAVNAETVEDGVTFLTTAPCAPARDGGPTPGYRLVRVKGEDFETEFVPLG